MENEQEIEILVEGEGLTDIEIIRLPRGSAARAILAAIAVKSGFPADLGFLFVENSEDPVEMTVLVENMAKDRIHHVHRARKIEVRVFYQGRRLDNRFSPSTHIQWVLDWAVGPEGFKIDPTIAPEMELSLLDQKTALPKNAHIGRYVRHPHCELDLDLIRGGAERGVVVSGPGPAERAVAGDLVAARFLAGCKRGRSRQISCVFPLLVVAVAAIEPDGSSGEFWFQFELTGFPGTAPKVRLWDPITNRPLAPGKRPKGSNRITEAFKQWGDGTV
jgi:hypothetical protein